jgi:RNA polymerase sigma-70 factor (ECF subfamily)
MGASAGTDPEQLLRLARTGSGSALGQLLELYRNYLSLLARLQIGRRLQGKADAADLVQETFLKAHRDFAAFAGSTEAEFVSWLRQILAANLAGLLRRYLGTQRRNLRLERELAGELDQSSHFLDQSLVTQSSSPSQKAVRREQAVLLADALGNLPEHYREVMILHHLEGLSLSAVAQRMNRTPDSVQKLWARALIQLRCTLGGSHAPTG